MAYPYGICEVDAAAGKTMQEYHFVNISRFGTDENAKAVFFEASGRIKIYIVNDLDQLVSGTKLQLALIGLKDLPFIPQPSDWVASIKQKVETDVGGGEIAIDRVTVEQLQCLPTDYEEFANLFLDGLNIKNPMLFRRRIQGLVSYFKGADERLLPRRTDLEKTLQKVEMSSYQFNRYLEVRWMEMKIDSRRGRSKMNEDLSTFRVPTRLVCDYALPPELAMKEISADVPSENKKPEKEVGDVVIRKLKTNPEK
jgi:hypothetical protein